MSSVCCDRSRDCSWLPGFRLIYLDIIDVPFPEGFVHVFSFHALERVYPDQSLYDLFRFLGYIVMDVLEVALSNLFEEFVLIFGSEWVISL